MLNSMKQFVVIFLYYACEVIDMIPWYSLHDRRWYRYGNLGCCVFGISSLALRLDEKWILQWIGKHRAKEEA